MATVNIEVLGTIRPDGSLELDQKVALPPGRVKVGLEAPPPQIELVFQGSAPFFPNTLHTSPPRRVPRRGDGMAPGYHWNRGK